MDRRFLLAELSQEEKEKIEQLEEELGVVLIAWDKDKHFFSKKEEI